jgi:DNA-binding transcriptional ArsR family regulator
MQSKPQQRLARDDVLDVLSNERRRYAMHFLKRHPEERVSLGKLSEHVAGWELDKPVDQLSYKERKRVQNALRQFHLPKMEERGFVVFDTRDGTVRLTETATRQEFYVDVLPRRGIPWGLYYIGLSVLSIVSLLGTWFALYPFTLLSPLAWCVGFAVMLTVSSVGHFYDNYYRMRLGAREKPDDVT